MAGGKGGEIRAFLACPSQATEAALAGARSPGSARVSTAAVAEALTNTLHSVALQVFRPFAFSLFRTSITAPVMLSLSSRDRPWFRTRMTTYCCISLPQVFRLWHVLVMLCQSDQTVLCGYLARRALASAHYER